MRRGGPGRKEAAAGRFPRGGRVPAAPVVAACLAALAAIVLAGASGQHYRSTRKSCSVTWIGRLRKLRLPRNAV